MSGTDNRKQRSRKQKAFHGEFLPSSFFLDGYGRFRRQLIRPNPSGQTIDSAMGGAKALACFFPAGAWRMARRNMAL